MVAKEIGNKWKGVGALFREYFLRELWKIPGLGLLLLQVGDEILVDSLDLVYDE